MNCIQNLSYIYLVYVLLILTYWTFTNVNVKVLKVPINTIIIIVKKRWLVAGGSVDMLFISSKTGHSQRDS